MSGLWALDEDWEADDVPAWLPDVAVDAEGNPTDEQDEPLGWEEDDDLEEVINPL